VLTVCCMLWISNDWSKPFSRDYDEEWVNRLFRGCQRNLSRPFRFVCITDRKRIFVEGVDQELMISAIGRVPWFGCLIEPFRLNVPMLFAGLDTVIVGNLDQMAAYCLSETQIALPRDLYTPTRSCNGIALVPAGHKWVWDQWLEAGANENDMTWLRRFPNAWVDDLFPGNAVSYRWIENFNNGKLDDVRVVYMAGRPKMNQLTHLDWIKAHWR